MGGDQVVVNQVEENQANMDNLQQGNEVERQELEEEKEVEAMDPVKQQVVQTGGNDETAGVETKTDVPVTLQTVQAQNVTVQGQGNLKGSLFSKTGFENMAQCKTEMLPEQFKKLGDLLDAYSNMINSGQGRDEQSRNAMIEILTNIHSLTSDYRKFILGPAPEKIAGSRKNWVKINKRNKGKENKGKGNKGTPQLNTAMSILLSDSAHMIERMRAGGNVIPQKQNIRKPFGKLPPAGMNPFEQMLKQEPDKAVEQVPPKQEPDKAVEQVPPKQEPDKAVEQVPLKQEPDKAVEQVPPKQENTQQQQEEPHEEEVQQQQAQTQTPESSGSSMKKILLDEMKLAAKTGGRAINPKYQEMIGHFEKLNTALGDTITETNQKESWEKLKDAYKLLTEASEKFAKADAPTAVGRICRRHARMLVIMCNFDMRVLKSANKKPDLAKKNTTWRQILEQPIGVSAAQQTESQDVAQTDQLEKGQAAQDFRNWQSRLEASEKGGLGWKNSKYFNRVQSALEEIVDVLSKGFGNVTQKNMDILLEACNAFQTLLDACKQYTARNPRTQKGQARRDLVLQLQRYAQRDLYGCGDAYHEFRSMPPEEQSKVTWSAVLSRTRTPKMTVDVLSKPESPGGGQASEVFKIDAKPGERPIAQYFKKEDSLDVSAGVGKKENAYLYIALQETLKKYPELSEEDKQALQTRVTSPGSEPKISKEGEKALEDFNNFSKKIFVSVSELMGPLGIVDEGGNANMTRRNVATSRIAELLGLGNLIAKSQTVDIFEKATGQRFRGNLMDQAEGVEYDEIKDAIAAKKVTSGFIRDAMNLQVLDMLCGQVDRHMGNMLYKTDAKGNVSGFQGIDNDAAFGTNTDAVSAEDSTRKDARVFDMVTGEMLVPYMDKQLADRIEVLDAKMVRYVLSDLLKEAEVDAVVKRLEVMKKGIKKVKEEHPERLLQKEEAWKKDTVGEELIEAYHSERKQANFNMEGARELFKDDPDMVAALELSETNLSEYNKKYTKEEKQKVIEAKRKVNVYLNKKHWANQNYYGRFMDE